MGVKNDENKQLKQMYRELGCTLTIIPGVNIITAVRILAEIGDIRRFPSKGTDGYKTLYIFLPSR